MPRDIFQMGVRLDLARDLGWQGIALFDQLAIAELSELFDLLGLRLRFTLGILRLRLGSHEVEGADDAINLALPNFLSRIIALALIDRARLVADVRATQPDRGAYRHRSGRALCRRGGRHSRGDRREAAERPPEQAGG